MLKKTKTCLEASSSSLSYSNPAKLVRKQQVMFVQIIIPRGRVWCQLGEGFYIALYLERILKSLLLKRRVA